MRDTEGRAGLRLVGRKWDFRAPFTSPSSAIIGLALFLALLLGCAPELGPGGPLAQGRYAVEAPNDAWSVGEEGGAEDRALFVRRRAADSADELAYVELLYFDRYLDHEDWVRSVGSQEQVLADLAALLRVELGRLSPGLEWVGREPLVASEPALSASWRFLDEKDQLNTDAPARTFNEFTLVLVGDELHLIAFYCYAERAEELVPEYERLKQSLAIDGRRVFPAGE